MQRLRRFLFHGAFVATIAAACARTVPLAENTPSSSPDANAIAPPLPMATTVVSAAAPPVPVPAPPVVAWAPPALTSIDGPHEGLMLDAGRPTWWAMPKEKPKPFRLVGHLHGMCGPPPYACGKWIGAGIDTPDGGGIMVCPTGNARCGDSPVSPASWEAPTWMELVSIMDHDLETSIAKVGQKNKGSIQREGAILTGYSRGGFAAPQIARMHPKRWPLLILIEANAPLTVAGLKSSGVKAVALVAGELGTEISGMQKTQIDLESAGFPAKLFVMKKTGHPYSEDMEYVMHDALAFVLAHENDE